MPENSPKSTKIGQNIAKNGILNENKKVQKTTNLKSNKKGQNQIKEYQKYKPHIQDRVCGSYFFILKFDFFLSFKIGFEFQVVKEKHFLI